MRAPQIIAEPGCATQIMADTGLISRDDARAVLTALIKAGFIVAPLEPTNSMFEAYMTAMKPHARTRRTIICNIGKARLRWKAMANAGMKVAFSRLALVDQSEGHLNSNQTNAGSSPAERANPSSGGVHG